MPYDGASRQVPFAQVPFRSPAAAQVSWVDMDFEVTHSYPAEPGRVARLLGDEEFLRSSARASGSVASRHDVSRSADGSFIVSSTRHMPAEAIPASIRGLVGSTIELKMVQAWSGPDAVGGRTATMTMDITGTPARCSGRSRLSGTTTTEVHHQGDVTVSIPLLGAAVEEAFVEAIRSALDAEHQVALDHLVAS